MGTTPLFVEQVVIGVQGAVWVGLLATNLVGPATVSGWVSQLEKWALLVTVMTLPLVYTLGLVLDRAFGGLATLVRLRKCVSRTPYLRALGAIAHDDDLIKLYERAGILQSYFQYLVVRARIALASCFNLPLITVGLIFNLDWQLWPPLLPPLTLFVLFLGVILTGLSVLTYVSLLETLEARGRQLLQDLTFRLAG